MEIQKNSEVYAKFPAISSGFPAISRARARSPAVEVYVRAERGARARFGRREIPSRRPCCLLRGGGEATIGAGFNTEAFIGAGEN